MSWTEENEGDIHFNEERRSFLFSEKALALLDALTKKMKVSSEKETLRCALNVLDWLVDEREKGNPVCLKTPEGILLVTFPFLPPMGHKE